MWSAGASLFAACAYVGASCVCESCASAWVPLSVAGVLAVVAYAPPCARRRTRRWCGSVRPRGAAALDVVAVGRGVPACPSSLWLQLAFPVKSTSPPRDFVITRSVPPRCAARRAGGTRQRARAPRAPLPAGVASVEPPGCTRRAWELPLLRPLPHLPHVHGAEDGRVRHGARPRGLVGGALKTLDGSMCDDPIQP